MFELQDCPLHREAVAGAGRALAAKGDFDRLTLTEDGDQIHAVLEGLDTRVPSNASESTRQLHVMLAASAAERLIFGDVQDDLYEPATLSQLTGTDRDVTDAAAASAERDASGRRQAIIDVAYELVEAGELSAQEIEDIAGEVQAGELCQ